MSKVVADNIILDKFRAVNSPSLPYGHNKSSFTESSYDIHKMTECPDKNQRFSKHADESNVKRSRADLIKELNRVRVVKFDGKNVQDPHNMNCTNDYTINSYNKSKKIVNVQISNINYKQDAHRKSLLDAQNKEMIVNYKSLELMHGKLNNSKY